MTYPYPPIACPSTTCPPSTFRMTMPGPVTARALVACWPVQPRRPGRRARPASRPTPSRRTRWRVVQGNFVSREQVDALKPGMARQQVRDILGTPLVDQRVHTLTGGTMSSRSSAPASQSQSAQARPCIFKGNELERFEGDPMPSEAEFVAGLDNHRKTGKDAAAGGVRGEPRRRSPPSSLHGKPAAVQPAATAPSACHLPSA
jgi:outer membrane protein assembly factor BamE